MLGRYLRKFGPEGKSLLEIGCGCGICGLVAAVHGFAKITMGDIVDDALDFARANILHNNLEEKAQARFLDVTGNDNIPPHDIIAASEILYLDELHRPLLKFIHGSCPRQAPLCQIGKGKVQGCRKQDRRKGH